MVRADLGLTLPWVLRGHSVTESSSGKMMIDLAKRDRGWVGEAQRREGTCPGTPSWPLAEPETDSRRVRTQAPALQHLT